MLSLSQRRRKQDPPGSSSLNSNLNESHSHNGHTCSARKSNNTNKRTYRRRTSTAAILFFFLWILLGAPGIQSKIGRIVARRLRLRKQLRHNTGPTLYQEQYLKQHPRMIAFLASPNKNDDKDHHKRVVVRIDANTFPIMDHDSTSSQQENFTKDDLSLASNDEPSRFFGPPQGCVPQHDWQTQMFPTCNALHEQDMMGQSIANSNATSKSKFLLGEGSWRSVWLVHQTLGLGVGSKDEEVAMKTLKYKRDLTERNLQRQKLDHIVAERLTASPHVLNIYAYCATSALYEFAGGGRLKGFGSWSINRKLEVAHQIASGVADLHDIDHDGRAAVCHGDIDKTQFVSSNGGKTYKLNDFNGAQLLFVRGRDHTTICPVNPSLMGGIHRSPEDYRDEKVTEKSDVYGMGNVLYTILVGNTPFTDKQVKDAQHLIAQGHRDPIPSQYKESHDPRIQAIVQGIEKCWIQEPNERANARTVAALLKAAME